MKKWTLWLILAVIFPQIAYTQQLNFQAAFDKKSIEIISSTGNDVSTHYIKPLVMKVKNALSEPLQVFLEAGTYFASEPAEYQDITVMADQLIVFKPNETKIIEISGVCTEPSNRAPSQKATYALSKIPNPEFAEFARFVSKEKLYHTSEAQTGMWFLCRGGTALDLIEQLHGCSPSIVYEKIFKQLCTLRKLTNIRLVTSETKTATAFEYRTQYFNGTELIKEYLNTDPIIGEKKYQVSLNGKTHSQYSYTLTESKKEPYCEMSGGGYFTVSQKNIKISIGMFDEKGILVREIYANDSVPVGKYTVKYAYDCEKYPDKTYYFKTIRNDKVAITVKLTKN